MIDYVLIPKLLKRYLMFCTQMDFVGKTCEVRKVPLSSSTSVMLDMIEVFGRTSCFRLDLKIRLD